MATLVSWKNAPLPTTPGVVLGTPILDTEMGIPTAPSLKILGGATAATGWIPTFTPQTILTARTYIHTPSEWPSQAFTVLSLRSSGSVSNAFCNISGTGAPGQIRLVKGTGGTTVLASPNGTVLPDTSYRIELQYNSALGTACLSLFAMGSDTPIWSSGNRTETDFQTPIDRVAWGKTNNTPVVNSDWWVDSLLVHDSYSLVGRDEDDLSVTPPASSGTVQRWNGTSLQNVSFPPGYSIGRWNGTSLVNII